MSPVPISGSFILEEEEEDRKRKEIAQVGCSGRSKTAGLHLCYHPTITTKKFSLERMNPSVPIWTNPNIASTSPEKFHV